MYKKAIPGLIMSIGFLLGTVLCAPVFADDVEIVTHAIDPEVYNIPVMESTYYIKSLYSNKFLTAGGGISFVLYQDDYLASAIQQFKLVAVEGTKMEDTYYNIIPIVSEKLRLDVSNADDKNGQKIQLFSENKAHPEAQLFKFVSLTSSEYQIIPKLSGTKFLEIAGPSKKSRAELQIWDKSNCSNQSWELVPVREPATGRQLELEVVPYKNPSGTSSICVNVINNAPYDVYYGTAYYIDSWNGINWEQLTSDDIAWEELGIHLRGNSTNITDYSLVNLKSNGNSLPDGKYRFRKAFNGENLHLDNNLKDNSGYWYYAEFEIE